MHVLPDTLCHLNGEFLPLNEAKISVLDRGFIFGDGVYDVAPVYGRRMFRFDEHMARLERGLQKIRITNPHGREAWLALCRRLVAALHATGQAVVSLVAEFPGDSPGPIVGHILFSRVQVAGCTPGSVLGLAPMAVLPEHQSTGIGSDLVRRGLLACRAYGAVACVVLGHPAYYPRFGFQPADTFGLHCQYDVPREAFMAHELVTAALSEASGLVRYAPEFQDL